jgi:hypothetical protein
MTTTQLRVYQLPPDEAEQEEWLAWWQEARALRERHGFRVVFAVLDPESGRFTWMVEHDGDFRAVEEAMVASPERAELFARERPRNQILETPFVRRIA